MVHAFGGLAMSKETRIAVLKVLGWLLVAMGVLIFAGDFVASEHTFGDFRTALKEGCFFVLFGGFFVVQAGLAERIHQLEKENAALRAAKGELGSSQGKAQP